MDTFLLQWNLNGVKTQNEKLTHLININKPQIICLQETNFKNEHHKHIKYFQCYHKNRANTTKASGGVAIYIRNFFNAKKINLNS